MKHINKKIYWASILVLVFSVFQNSISAAEKAKSKDGVALGTITYSYRSMPDQSLEAILNYIVQSDIHTVELMGEALEAYAGIPQTKDAELKKEWRAHVSMKKFKEARKMFEAKGVKINIVKFGGPSWSDEELDYAFNVAKTMGAKGISMEIADDAAKRVSPFAEKHNLYLIFHNHGQPGDPKFSFDHYLAYSPSIMLNFDAGHYFGATGKNPCDLITRLHNRIVSVHVKDKTGPDATPRDRNQEFGKGQTPIGEMLQLVKKNQWPIEFDIELEYDIPQGSDAVKEVSKCVKYCQAAL